MRTAMWWRSWLFWLNVTAVAAFLCAPVYTCGPMLDLTSLDSVVAWARFQGWFALTLPFCLGVLVLDVVAIVLSLTKAPASRRARRP